MARPSLKGNITSPAAKRGAQVAKALARKKELKAADSGDYQGETETVSYNLPIELIELYRDLAEARLQVERREKRVARREAKEAAKNGQPMPAIPQARRSASAIVREAMEAYADKVRVELDTLRKS